jgi:hypothetical protein
MRAATALAVALAAGATRADETSAPIGHLAFRDHTVTLSASAAGPRFTLRDREGSLLESELTLEELIAREPEVGHLVESAVAGGLIWAGGKYGADADSSAFGLREP